MWTQSGKYIIPILATIAGAQQVAADQNEVGDLCVTSSGTIASPKMTYAVQGEWDNTAGSCKGGAFSSP